MICKNCGKEYEGRPNSTYCSSSCKQAAYRTRKVSVTKDTFVYTPPTVSNLDNRIVSTVTDGVVSGVSDSFGGNVQRGLNDLFKLSNTPFYTLAIGASAALGAYVGFSYADDGKKLANSIVGAGIGFLVGQFGYTIYTQFSEYYRQKQDYLEKHSTEDVSLGSNARVLSSSDIVYMNVPTIQINGVWGDFLGYNLNYNFAMMVYGSPGGGKSHFSTMLSGHLEEIGKVLYVLAEEGVTNSVKERIQRYSLKNTDFLVTRKPEDVLNIADKYRFVVIDSINGMVQYNNHLQFVEQLRNKNLYGLVIVNQVNKSGSFTGKNELLHEIDTEIEVEGGIARTLKNRFDQHTPKSVNIFPSRHKAIAENIGKSVSVMEN